MDNSSSGSNDLKRKIDNSSNCDDNNKSIKLNGSQFSELFYRVWHNVVLRNQILKSVHLLNKFDWVYIKSHEELENHQFRDYITRLLFGPSSPIRIDLLQSLSSLTSLSLRDFDQPLLPGMIAHSGINHLHLPSFNQPLTKGCIPSSVKKLGLIKFNQPLSPGMIPHSVADLALFSFNHPLTKGCIPSSVKILYLESFDQPLLPNDQCAIPDSVTKLELRSFNQALVANSLPSSITDLELICFNQPLVVGSIPSSVTDLCLNGYQLPLSKYSIPQSVTTLHLYGYTNQSLKNLPSSVTDLTLNEYGPIKKGTIPESITYLEFLYESSYPIETGTLPSSIQSIRINRKEFEIGKDFQDASNFNYTPKNNQESEDGSD